jgi:hypothetical protein
VSSKANDARIKRVLKRYRKGNQFVDSSVDVSDVDTEYFLQAFGCTGEDSLVLPKELDESARTFLGERMRLEFDGSQFDYFLHSYVRAEFVPSYYEDPSVTYKPAPENGPPEKIPVPEGMRWVNVRPKEGKEHYEAYEIEKGGDEEGQGQ